MSSGLHLGHPEPLTLPLERAIEDSYALLCCEHCGRQDNYGSFGEFDFRVAERRIELEFNQRYTDHETSTHTYPQDAAGSL